MANMGTKAQTLCRIIEEVKSVRVLPSLIITTNEYENHKNGAIVKIQEYFQESLLIVRSSTSKEDSQEASFAGHYQSVLNVEKSNKQQLEVAINEVISSYELQGDEEVLIQPMLQNIQFAGVIFTADIDTLASYYVLNYEEGGGSEGITSGCGTDFQTKVMYKKYNHVKEKEEWITTLLEQCATLEVYFENEYLDIEFGVDSNFQVTIFQVRPIANSKKRNSSGIELDKVLGKLYKKIEKLSRPHPNLLGTKTVFGLMPDWNPAEIIGVRPKKLALSLYKELITDSIWAHQRSNYGYRNLIGHPLLVTFAGVPYVDVRITFNSFIPSNLHENIAKKLMEYYMNKIIAKPKYHDKVEFQIVFSCYYLGVSDKLQELKQYDFNENEIKRIEFALLELTNQIIHPETGLYQKDIQKVQELELRYENITTSEISLIDKIYWLIEDCKQFGTLPFAGVARAAFIAMEFLKSFVELEILTASEYDIFLNSIQTINKSMQKDLNDVYTKQLSKEDFLDIYGHIRPGTYEITSERYDENFELYFSKPAIDELDKVQVFGEDKLQLINEKLIESGITINANQLIQFIKEAIEGREYTKFIFTKSLSKILVYMEELGNQYGISREEMAFLNILQVKQLYSSLECFDLKEIFMENIAYNKRMYGYTQNIKLPSIILKPEDVYSYTMLEEEPNYVTQKVVSGEVVEENNIQHSDVEGKIVFIRSADPGYDFLFGKHIGGLVSQWGGANSHMAIRCAELGIPAVIGIGEQEYNKWITKEQITIDCSARKMWSLE